eukprot:CAMPEP_0198153304 /NCGR_PEP_ID=MMETSP1443-20131203/63538_1 /TAXON_ID=186043 /ORGANISM="Entomoneis sp., Strain CCMP2396" /LENGTH=183 /DNA_ID=CAMNT_0043819591 /DNA_START=52 /DNA_END=603 /DNA_ORIENTATION=+
MSNSSILSLPSEWDHDRFTMDEESSATSSEEASKVFEQWQTEDDGEMDMMDLDDRIDSNLSGDEIAFIDFCPSPTTPMDELNYMHFGDRDMEKYSLNLVDITSDDEEEDSDKTSSLSFQQRYEATLQKLADSMKRSQETRKSLVMRTKQTEHYARSPVVSGVVESIETSSRQLRTYLKEARAC